MRKLKSVEIKDIKEILLRDQGGICEICKQPLILDSGLGSQAVADHCHKTGSMRGVIHRGCNVLLAKVEKGARHGVKDVLGFALGVGLYMQRHSKDQYGLLHPSFRTPTEKKILAAKRKKRKAKLK